MSPLQFRCDAPATGPVVGSAVFRVAVFVSLVFCANTLRAQLVPRAGQAIAPVGRISGKIQDTTGHAVNAAVAIYSRTPSATTPYNVILRGSADGSFATGSVPDGTYAICPIPPSMSLLPTCSWETEPTVTVSGGNAVVASTIQLKPAVDLYIRILDLNGTFAKLNGVIHGASILTGVRTPTGRFIRIPTTATDALGIDRHLPVPAGTPLVIQSFSSGYSLLDFSGNAVKAGAGVSVTVTIPTTQAQLKQTLTIL